MWQAKTGRMDTKRECKGYDGIELSLSQLSLSHSIKQYSETRFYWRYEVTGGRRFETLRTGG